MTPEYLVWLDHCEPSNPNVWWSPTELAELDGPTRVETVGFVVREEEDWLAVAGQLTDDGMTSQPLVIIKSCIVVRKPFKTR